MGSGILQGGMRGRKEVVMDLFELTRSAFPAMQSTAVEILKNHRALEVDSKLMPFKEIITLIDDM